MNGLGSFSLFKLCRELKNPSVRRINIVIASNVAIVFVVYLLIGLFGYLAFLDKTEGNILENYAYDDVPIQIGALGITIAVIFYVPLNTHPCRITVDWMLTNITSYVTKVGLPINLGHFIHHDDRSLSGE